MLTLHRHERLSKLIDWSIADWLWIGCRVTFWFQDKQPLIAIFLDHFRIVWNSLHAECVGSIGTSKLKSENRFRAQRWRVHVYQNKNTDTVGRGMGREDQKNSKWWRMQYWSDQFCPFSNQIGKRFQSMTFSDQLKNWENIALTVISESGTLCTHWNQLLTERWRREKLRKCRQKTKKWENKKSKRFGCVCVLTRRSIVLF